jgi:hypothetical protein
MAFKTLAALLLVVGTASAAPLPGRKNEKALGPGKNPADYVTGRDINGILDHTAGAVNVKSHGATGDGTTDDTAAIQAAIDAAKLSTSRSVSIPAGFYRVCSINLRGFEALTILGAGAGSGRPDGHVTMLRSSCAGKIMFDTTGSNSVVLRDLHLWGDESAKPSAGILMSRPTEAPGAENSGVHLFTNVWVSGHFTKAAVVSLSSEVNKYVNCVFQNKEPGGHGFWTENGNAGIGLASDFGLIPNVQAGGNTGFAFFGTHFLAMPTTPTGTESAVKGTFADAKFYGTYTATTGKAALEITGPSERITIDGHRDETGGNGGGYGVYFGASADQVSIKGSVLMQVYGADGVSVDRLHVAASDITWSLAPDPPGPWAINVDILKNSVVNGWVNNTKVRTTATSNDFGIVPDGYSLSLPSDSHGNRWVEEKNNTVPGYLGTVREIRVQDNDAKTHVYANRLSAAKFLTKPQAIVASTVPGFNLNPFDAASGSFVTVTLDHLLVITSLAHSATQDPGAALTFLFKQDGTGGHGVSFPADVDLRDFVIDSRANAISSVTLVADPVLAKWVAVAWTTPKLRATVTVDLPSISTCTHTDIPLVGAQEGAECTTSLPPGFPDNIHAHCHVDPADNVDLHVCSTGGAPHDPDTKTYSVRVFNP